MEATNLVSVDTSAVFKIDIPYSPLVVSGDGRWTCNFQLKPSVQVVVTGEKPSELEFIHAMQSSNAPVCLIQALYVAACVAFEALNQ